MKHTFFLLATALCVASAAPVMAADNYDTARVGDSTVTSTPLTGAYTGVSAGYGWRDIDGPGGSSGDLDGGDYGLFAGYKVDALLDQTINRTGLGLNGAIEVHYDWSDGDDSQTVGAVTTSAEKNHEYGIQFRPGISILSGVTPFTTNPYGIIGWKRAEFEGTATGGGFATSGKETYDGFELGLGTEVLAYNNVGVRVDYSHTWYEENNGFEPDEDNVKVGVAYHF